MKLFFYENYEQDAPIYNLSEDTIKKKAKKKILVLYGWLFRDQENFERLEPYIRRMFAVKDMYSERASQLLCDVRKDCTVVIGVHIRRGDYKSFENGKWFYKDKVYLEKMKTLYGQLEESHGRIGFLLCSNERLDLSNFSGLPVYNFRDCFIVDFLLLTMSDYIIGPPSTFSAFASYYGNTPLQFISDEAYEPDVNHFSICSQL